RADRLADAMGPAIDPGRRAAIRDPDRSPGKSRVPARGLEGEPGALRRARNGRGGWHPLSLRKPAGVLRGPVSARPTGPARLAPGHHRLPPPQVACALG